MVADTAKTIGDLRTVSQREGSFAAGPCGRSIATRFCAALTTPLGAPGCVGCKFVMAKVHASSDASSGYADVAKTLQEVCSVMPDVFFDAVRAQRGGQLRRRRELTHRALWLL